MALSVAHAAHAAASGGSREYFAYGPAGTPHRPRDFGRAPLLRGGGSRSHPRRGTADGRLRDPAGPRSAPRVRRLPSPAQAPTNIAAIFSDAVGAPAEREPRRTVRSNALTNGVGDSLAAERTVVPGMTLRDSSLRAATAPAVCAAALLVAGCGGGNGDATPGNPSNDTSVCAYTKRVGSGNRVWVQIAVTPVSLEPTACSASNGGFSGRRLPPVGRMGTGHVYCA